MWHPKPKPKQTDDICVKHNRRLRDYEVMNGGCFLCCQEANQPRETKTVINVLPPEPHRCKHCGAMTTQPDDQCYLVTGFICPIGWGCKEQCNQCLENGKPYIKV